MYENVYECHYALNSGRALKRLHIVNIKDKSVTSLRNQTIISHKVSDRWIRIKTQNRISMPNNVFVLYNRYKNIIKKIDTSIYYNRKDKKFLLGNDLLKEDDYCDGRVWELVPMQPSCKLRRINFKKETL